MWLLNHSRDLAWILTSPPFLAFHSFCVPFSNVNGNTVAAESRVILYSGERRLDLFDHFNLDIDALYSWSTIYWLTLYASNGREREKFLFTWNMNKYFNVSLASVPCSHCHSIVTLFMYYRDILFSRVVTFLSTQLWKTDPYLLWNSAECEQWCLHQMGMCRDVIHI